LYTITVSSVDGATIYVDANSILTDPNVKGASMDPTGDIYVGARNDLNVDRFYGNPSIDDGLVDDLRLYNRVLSSTEVATLAAGGVPQPPSQASNPSPADSAADVSINADLSWSAGSGATSHDVYFGTSSPGSFQGNQTATTFDTGSMSNDTTYYWRIDEINAEGTTAGTVWNFTTIVAAPSQASNPSPADSATDVSIDADLSWTTGSGSTSSDVYFGTTSPGAFQGNQTATTFDPGTMSNNTTYYWRIDEINAAGTTTGVVWSFTTVPAPTGDVEIIGSWVSGTSHTAEAGTNRLLVFTGHVEDNNADMDLTSVTYGGQAMTKVVEQNVSSGYRAYVVAYVLDEAGINAASGSDFVVTWTETPSRSPGFSSVFLQNVNQTAPTAATDGNGTTSSATLATSALSTNDGDMVFVAGTCGNSGTYSVNNGFTEGIEISIASADAVAGYKAATGAVETPSITHSNVNRQVIIGFVVQAE
jgi:hypothetical protein